METWDQRTTSEAQRAEHAGAVSENDTAGELDNTAVRESAAAGAPAEQELTLEAQQEQLAEQGRKVEPIPTVGQVFDPAYHEVLSTVPATAETPANTIVTEVKAGYRINGRLLTPAQVIVARAEEP